MAVKQSNVNLQKADRAFLIKTLEKEVKTALQRKEFYAKAAEEEGALFAEEEYHYTDGIHRGIQYALQLVRESQTEEEYRAGY